MIKTFRYKTIEEIKNHIKSELPSFYFSSQTSTVIPYDKLEDRFKDTNFNMVDLSALKSSIDLTSDNNLIVRGPISWKEAKIFLKDHKRNIQTAPTEELALICAGAATSATGERCFHYGTLRSQIVRLKYLNFQGQEIELTHSQTISKDITGLKEYQNQYKKYAKFKNAPFPRFEKEIDLLIGTEGQLGVITEVEIKTAPLEEVNHLFMLVPKWEENIAVHVKIQKLIQNFREEVVVCELIDSNGFNYLPKEERPNKNKDAIFLEIRSTYFESFYEDFITKVTEFINEEEIFEIAESKFHMIRAAIPRAVYEINSHKGVIKKGTDIQVSSEQFELLLNEYKKCSMMGVDYMLFGHFGDAHLHFNFMPSSEQATKCQEQLEILYSTIQKIGGSPFAEHGIGLIKQDFIKQYWTPEVLKTFKSLKDLHDPKRIFFPEGFMNIDDL